MMDVRDSSIFDGLSSADLDQLLAGLEQRRFPANSVVLAEGDAPRDMYVIQAGQADVFITYCTNATLARREEPRLRVLPVPEAINVSACYGLALLDGPHGPAPAYARYLLGPQGQAILASFGFSPP